MMKSFAANSPELLVIPKLLLSHECFKKFLRNFSTCFEYLNDKPKLLTA